MAELYRRKDGESGDVQVNHLTKENVTELTLWCGGVQVEEIDPFNYNRKYAAINVPTKLGMQRATEGDYILQGSEGDFWPMNPWRFEHAYEKVG